MTTDTDAAVAIAQAAGAVLQEVRRDFLSGAGGASRGAGDTAGAGGAAGAGDAADLRALKDRGDAAAQAEIARLLAERFPGDAVLSEEAVDAAGTGSAVDRLLAERVWIIDPLDGTREYSESRADWAVHVALWERSAADGGDGGLTAGAVAIPDEGVVLHSGPGGEVPARSDGPLRIAVSRSRPPELVNGLVERLAARGVDSALVAMGSAGVKIASVVRGITDAYVHGGGQYQWDSAAPVAVARAYGLWASRLDGSPLIYNGADAYLPDLVVCRPEYAEMLLAEIAAAGQAVSGD